MQVTLDLPDDVFAKADAVAKQESRSLGSVLADLIRGMNPALRPATTPSRSLPSSPLAMLGYARQFHTGAIPSTDEIMRELRAGDRE